MGGVTTTGVDRAVAASAADDAVDVAQQTQRLWTPRLLLLLLTSMSFGFCFSAFFILPKYLALELSAGPSQIGYVTAVVGFASTIATPLTGRWIDRHGRRRMITLGALITAIASAAHMGIDRVGPALYLLGVVRGVGLVMAFNAAATAVTDLAPPQRLSQAIGLHGASMLCMNGVAPYVLEPLAAQQGWSMVFAASAAAGLLAAALSLTLPADDVATSQSTAVRDDLLRRWFAGRWPTVLTIGAAGLVFGAMITFYQPFALQLGIEQVSVFFVGYALAAIGVRLTLGSLPDRLGRRRVAVGALICYAGVTALMAALQAGHAVGYRCGIWLRAWPVLPGSEFGRRGECRCVDTRTRDVVLQWRIQRRLHVQRARVRRRGRGLGLSPGLRDRCDRALHVAALVGCPARHLRAILGTNHVGLVRRARLGRPECLRWRLHK